MVSAEQALSSVQSGHRIFIHGASATPQVLIKALVSHASRLANVEILHLHTVGDPLYAKPEMASHFQVRNLFLGANMRPYLNFNSVDYLPCFLSEISSLFRTGKRRPDVALVQVSLPDKHGYCSLGTSIDIARAAVDTAEIVIAQVNRWMPRTHGDGMVHVSRFQSMVEGHEPLPETFQKKLSDEEIKIGKNVSALVDDGATLQLGIGTIPDAVLNSLGGHKNLGVHSEMWSDGLLPLLESGAVNNSLKKTHPGKTIAAFIIGSKKVYDFIDDNPSVALLDAGYVNNPRVIAKNNKVTAINSAVEIDLTGQVCADSVGHQIISGVGGQVDFIHGATLSDGGKPIIAMTSRAKKGASRIVATLKDGAGVVTTRAHVHFVVTEYGVADLFGKSLSERAQALIQIAHPEDREKLKFDWKKSITG